MSPGALTFSPYAEEDTVPTNPLNSGPGNRIRWATQRVTGAKAGKKRASIFRRLSSRRAANDDPTKGESAGADLDAVAEGNEGAAEQGGPGRRIFFNQPLPNDARDEEGHPTTQFVRNKIRTAKYTPLSFIPKNLWFQFHNIANIYFLFIIILSVRLLEDRKSCRNHD